MKAKYPHRTGVQHDLSSRISRFTRLQRIARSARSLKEADLTLLEKQERKALLDFLNYDIPDLLAEAHVSLDCHDPITKADLRRINGILVSLYSTIKAGKRPELPPWMRAILIVLEQYDTSEPAPKAQ